MRYAQAATDIVSQLLVRSSREDSQFAHRPLDLVVLVVSVVFLVVRAGALARRCGVSIRTDNRYHREV